MKYIVIYILIQVISVVCPDANKDDQFGRTIPNNCSLLHTRTVTDTITRQFSTKDSATAFYNSAKVLCEGRDKATLYHSVICQVKRDSVAAPALISRQ